MKINPRSQELLNKLMACLNEHGITDRGRQAQCASQLMKHTHSHIERCKDARLNKSGDLLEDALNHSNELWVADLENDLRKYGIPHDKIETCGMDLITIMGGFI